MRRPVALRPVALRPLALRPLALKPQAVAKPQAGMKPQAVAMPQAVMPSQDSAWPVRMGRARQHCSQRASVPPAVPGRSVRASRLA